MSDMEGELVWHHGLCVSTEIPGCNVVDHYPEVSGSPSDDMNRIVSLKPLRIRRSFYIQGTGGAQKAVLHPK